MSRKRKSGELELSRDNSHNNDSASNEPDSTAAAVIEQLQSPPLPSAYDAALDFLSPHFDPLRALYEQALEPLVPVSARDNVAACGCLLHERDPLYRADNTEKKAERVNKRKQTAADEQHKRAMKMEMEAAKKIAIASMNSLSRFSDGFVALAALSVADAAHRKKRRKTKFAQAYEALLQTAQSQAAAVATTPTTVTSLPVPTETPTRTPLLPAAKLPVPTAVAAVSKSLPTPKVPSSLPFPALPAPTLPAPSLPVPAVKGAPSLPPPTLAAPSVPPPSATATAVSVASSLPPPTLPAPSLPSPTATLAAAPPTGNLPPPTLPARSLPPHTAALPAPQQPASTPKLPAPTAPVAPAARATTVTMPSLTAPSDTNSTADVHRTKAVTTTAATTDCAAPLAGPMDLLRTLYTRKSRVKIWIRRWRGLRGTLTGFLLAFDRHFNLVLLDVEEDYTVMLWKRKKGARKSSAGHSNSNTDGTPNDNTTLPQQLADNASEHNGSGVHEPATAPPSSTHERVEVRKQRHFNQLFVRGDNIVLLGAAP